MFQTVAVVVLVLVGLGCGGGDAEPCDRDVADLVAEVERYAAARDTDAIRELGAELSDNCPARSSIVLSQLD
jgi:hypothetical protein